MPTYTVMGAGETWESIAETLDLPCSALLQANCLDPSLTWPPPEQGEQLALPDQPDDAAVAPENDHVLDGGEAVESEFDVPPQKTDILDQPTPPWADAPDVGSPQPFLVASNDDSVVASLVAQARQADATRSTDTTGPTAPGGTFIPVRVVGVAGRPPVRWDHGFLDDGHGNIDDSKRRAPTVADILSREKWAAKLLAAKLARPDLAEATTAYDHFLDATGSDLTFSYDDYVARDRAGACTLHSAVEDIRAGVIQLHEGRAMTDDSFVVQTGAIGVNGENPRYPYPGTEDWQKAIGAHVIWLEATVKVDAHSIPGRRKFFLAFTLHAEDRYNFNPHNKDIATGIKDAENGAFEVTGLGKEFMSFATLTRQIRFTLPLAAAADLRATPPDQVVLAPGDPDPDAAPAGPTVDLDGGLPPGGVSSDEP